MDPNYSMAGNFSKFIDYDDYTIIDSVFNAVKELQYGVPIPVIGSLVPTTPRSRCSILGFISLVPVASTRFSRIGLITITGCALLCI